MNVRTRILTKEEFEKIVEVISYGFEVEGRKVKPNPRMAALCIVQANTGLRIGDLLRLRLRDIVREGGRYHLQIIESKTHKERNFTIAPEVYTYIQSYALEQGIGVEGRLFDLSSRAVNKHLVLVGRYLNLERLGSHSFRKYYAMSIYNANGYNIELVRELLQHSNVSITQHYIGVSPQLVERALLAHVCIPDIKK